MATRRQERVAKRVVQELTEAFRNLKHVNLGFITVTKCEMSPDLRHAKVFVSVWGDEDEQKRNLHILHQYAGRLRGMIGRPLGLKVLPDLHFAFDESLATADQISRLIRDARSTNPNPEPLTPEEEAELLAKAGSIGEAAREVMPEDPFEAVRLDVEDELLDVEDDPTWRPVNLDELPDDDEDEDGSAGGRNR